MLPKLPYLGFDRLQTPPASSRFRSFASSGVRASLLLLLLLLSLAGAADLAGASPLPASAVGVLSGPYPVQVTIVAGGQVSNLAVLTNGLPNLDFLLADPGACAAGSTVTVGQVCQVTINIKPRFPGQRQGAVVLTDAAGNVLGMATMNSVASGPLLVFVPGQITTVAGNDSWLYRGDGGPATTAPIFLPYGVAVNAAGDLFIADSNNNRIRRVDAATGNISTYAGNGSSGQSGDGGAATAASVSTPTSVVLDAAGNLYFSDSGNHAIRFVSATTGLISTVVGTLGQQGYSGDGGPATAARLSGPNGLALDGKGHLYFADTGNNVVRVVDLVHGVISAFAGSGATTYTGDGGSALVAGLNTPWGVTVSSAGEVYIADQYNHAIRKVDVAGNISTVAGTGYQGYSGDGGPAASAHLNEPASVAIDAAGNLYIADSGNSVVRKVGRINGVISTIAGNASKSFAGDGGPADQAGLYGPYTLAIDGPGNLYIADLLNNRIRKVSSNVATRFFDDIRVQRVSPPQNQSLENNGNAPLNITSVQAASNSQVDTANTTCSTTQPIVVDGFCVVVAKFAPTQTGNPVTGKVVINSDAANTPGTFKLVGNVLSLDPPTVAVQSDGSPSATGATVTFTASVTSAGTMPTGNVTLNDGNTALGTAALNAQGRAVFSINTLTVGSHSITLAYAGDNNNAPGTSPAITQTVKDATTTGLSSSANPATVTAPVTFTATVSGASSPPTGTVSLLDGGSAIASATPVNGVATFTLSNLAAGNHILTASFTEDSHDLGSVSAAVTQTIQKSLSSTTLSSSNNDVPYSTAISLIATVSSASAGVPTGTVSFQEGATLIGSAPLDSHGVATLPNSTLPVGVHTLSAVFSGDASNETSAYQAYTQTIEKIATSTTLASDANPSNSGTVLHLTATVSPAQTAPSDPVTGDVSFFDGSVSLGSSAISNGAATLNVSSLAVGAHSLSARFAGAQDYASSSSVTLSQQVQKATTSGTLSAAPTPLAAGKPGVLTATLTSPGVIPTGSVLFKDGGTSLGQGTLDTHGVASLAGVTLPPGTHALTAVYAGDSNSLPTTASLSLAVQQATTATTLATNANPAVATTTLLLKASVTGNGGIPTGRVTFYDGTVNLGSQQVAADGTASLPVSTLAVGSHTLTATYGGDTDDAGSASNTVAETIQQTTSSTAVTSSPNPSAQGSAVQIAVRVMSNGGVPGGSVRLLDGTSSLGTSSLNAAGIASFTLSTLSLGSHNLSAVYAGDANDAGSTSPVLVQVVQPTTVATITSDHNPAYAGAVLLLSSAVSGSSAVPTGTVTFRDGALVLGTSALNGSGVATLPISTLGPGTHPLTASFSGDGANAASTSAVLQQAVQQASTEVRLALSSSSATVSTGVILTATVAGNGGTPGGHVTFLEGGATLGTANVNSAGVATLNISTLPLGPHTLTAAYIGDTNDTSSNSGPQQLTIVKASPTLAISSDSNPSQGGAPVTFRTMLQSGVNTPTGSVTWSDGGAVLQTSPLSPNGVATVTMSTLTVGQHLISASYSGDSSNLGANSSVLAQVVQVASSAVALVSSHNPAAVGDTVTYSVAVTGAGSQPAGTVLLRDGAASLGTLTLDGQGKASLPPLTVSGPGTHTITAVYSGDSFHSGSQAAPLAQAVLQSTSAALVSSANPSIAGRSVTLTATVTGANGVIPTGTVSFQEGANVLGTSPATSAGTAVLSTAALSVGQHAIVAVYGGDNASQPSTSAGLVETIDNAGTSVTLSSNVNPSTSGAPVTFSAHVTGQGGAPTGSVTFQDGPVNLGHTTLSAAGIATLTTSTLTPGPHTVTAVYGGDANDLVSTSPALSQLVLQRTSVTVVSSSNPVLTADPVTFTIRVTNAGVGIPSGTVALQDGTATVGSGLLASDGTITFSTSSLAAGQHSLIANYSGDQQNFTSSSDVFAQNVTRRPTQISLTTSVTTAIEGQTVTLIAVVTGSGPATPSGTVVFTAGKTTLGSAPVNPSGVATLNLTPSVGVYTALAAYGGDTLYAPSNSPSSGVQVDPSSHFTMTVNPGDVSMQKKQHTTLTVTLASVKSFQDVLALGCSGLPFAATCTFSNDQVTLNADGTATATVVLDTGTPLTAGGQAQARNVATPGTGAMLCFLPVGALASLLLFRARRRRPLAGLVLMLCLMATVAGMSGCGALNVNGTPPGKYALNITATGAKSRMTVAQTVTLTVTQ